jgi:hypothetical protein
MLSAWDEFGGSAVCSKKDFLLLNFAFRILHFCISLEVVAAAAFSKRNLHSFLGESSEKKVALWTRTPLHLQPNERKKFRVGSLFGLTI